MIVKMQKIYIASHADHRKGLLETLRDVGVVHLTPAKRNVTEDKDLQDRIDRAERASQILMLHKPAGQPPEAKALEVIDETLRIQHLDAEAQARLTALHLQLRQTGTWGDLRLEPIHKLADAGLSPLFVSVPRNKISSVEGELVQVLGELPQDRLLLGVIERRREFVPPPEVEILSLPQRDAPSIRAEATEIQEALKARAQRLGQLAHLLPQVQAEIEHLQRQARFLYASRGGLESGAVFGLQGWIPAENVDALKTEIGQAGLSVAYSLSDPVADDLPPTLVRPPRWAKPITGLFDILGTVPGYAESDVSAMFMIMLPLFAAMLIGDAGYGLLFALVPLLFYRRFVKIAGQPKVHLVLIIGAATVIWGSFTATFFGHTWYDPIIPVNLSEESRFLVSRISFIIATLHLSLAKLWRAANRWPSLSSVGDAGWAIFLWGMYGVVCHFVLKSEFGYSTPWPYLLYIGGTLAVLFNSPSRNIPKTLLLGVANFPLAMMGTFSDTISYVRLMAVGLASGVLGANFNKMAFQLDFWPAMVLVLVLGHGLNFALTLIALFAHGVRLNMLEFCSNLGMQWTGYLYSPFKDNFLQEKR